MYADISGTRKECETVKIALVIDQYDCGNNGTTMSARNLVGALRGRGHEVRVVCIGAPGEDKYVVPELYIPIGTPVSHRQGMSFAKPEREVLTAAFAWADVIHFYMPFMPLAVKGRRLAEEMGVPYTGAFHVQPENITFNCGLKRSRAAPELVYRLFRRYVYNSYTHLHCPTKFIAGELEKRGFTAKLHVISNGVDGCFTYAKADKPEEYRGRFCILMIGRLSNEKRQDLLIEAASLSRHSEDIQLFFAGSGPKKSRYAALGEKLVNAPSFGFYSRDELKALMSRCDLYVHTADAEIEAIACIEAFSTGLVPVISNSKRSATGAFALDKRSLFAAGDARSLAEKIDYWFEHPEERGRMERVYSERGKLYTLERSAALMEEMFNEALEESTNEGRSFDPREHRIPTGQ